MIIQEIPSKDTLLFIAMFNKMNQMQENDKITEFQSACLILDTCRYKTNFVAFGLYNDNDELQGFACGYEIDNETYFLLGIYLIEELRNQATFQNLLSHMFIWGKKHNYKYWEILTTNETSENLISHFSCKKINTKYRGLI